MANNGPNGGHVTVRNNFIRDWGSGSDGTRAVYLDDYSTNVTVTGNVMGAPGSSGSFVNVEEILVHNGANNAVTGNIMDLGSTGNVWTAWYGYDGNNFGIGMAGNIFENNIVISHFAGNQNTDFGGTAGYSFLFWNNSEPGSYFTIQNNLYFNYGGGQSPLEAFHRPSQRLCF